MIKVAWVGMPTAEDAKKTAEGWLERVPPGVKVVRGKDPSSNVRIAFGLDSLGATGIDLFARERFRKGTVLVVDDYLNAKTYHAKKRGVWFAKMVRMLLFVSTAEREMFRRMYPDVRTGWRILPIVPVPVKKRKKRKKRSMPVRTSMYGSDEEAPRLEELPAEPDPMEEYSNDLDKSAKEFWALIIRLAR